MSCVGGVRNLWTFTLLRSDSAVNKNIRRNYLRCFLFKDTLVRTTEKHKTGITPFLTSCATFATGLPLPHGRTKTCTALVLFIVSYIGCRSTVNENVTRSVRLALQ